jgi:hypothetical protein
MVASCFSHAIIDVMKLRFTSSMALAGTAFVLAHAATAQAAPPAEEALDGLARMILGAATGKNTGAAGVPSLLSGRNIESALERACGEVNGVLPLIIDKESILVRCRSFPSRRVMLQIKLSNFAGPTPDLASFEVRFAPSLQRNICVNADVQILARMGVDLRYRYLTSDNRRIGDVFINSEVCQQALRAPKY